MLRMLAASGVAALCTVACAMALVWLLPQVPALERALLSIDGAGSEALSQAAASARERIDERLAGVQFSWVALVVVPALLSPLMFRAAPSDDARASGRRESPR